MKCMRYSNENHINIIPQQDFEELTLEVFNVIAENISKSLGPLGSSATIFDGSIVEATKDGFHILDKYIFHNRYKKMIYNLIKTPCTKMNNTVGDGTTTAITLANELFKTYQNEKAHLKPFYRLPRQLTSAWTDVVKNIIERMGGLSKPVDPEDYDTIYNLAYISSNGNHDIADNIARTYKESKSPAIKMKDSPTNKSYIEAVNGFEFPCDVIDPIYVKNQDLTATEKYVYTMLFDHKIEHDEYTKLVIPVSEVVRAMGHKLLVIAPEFDEMMLENVAKGYVQREIQQYRSINTILMQYPMGKLKQWQKEDLAVVLKSVVINQNLRNSIIEEIAKSDPDYVVERMVGDNDLLSGCIGKADEALLSMGNGTIFKVSGLETDDKYKSTLEFAKKELQDVLSHVNYEQKSYSSKVYNARARVMQLEMRNYIYYIGADSELQKQILHDAVDDVIKCVRSAVVNGVVPGCQISLIKAARKYMEDLRNVPIDDDVALRMLLTELIETSCISVFKKVLCGPDGTGMNCMSVPVDIIVNQSIEKNSVFDLESLDYNDKIITSAETDMMVLTAASELIKILTSGNQCIFLDSEVNSSHQDDITVYA